MLGAVVHEVARVVHVICRPLVEPRLVRMAAIEQEGRSPFRLAAVVREPTVVARDTCSQPKTAPQEADAPRRYRQRERNSAGEVTGAGERMREFGIARRTR